MAHGRNMPVKEHAPPAKRAEDLNPLAILEEEEELMVLWARLNPGKREILLTLARALAKEAP
jgi:hypothetical protein